MSENSMYPSRLFGARVLGLATIALLAVGAGTANATLIITFSQDGANVDASGVGSLNFNGLTFDSFDFADPFVNASSGTVLLGVPSSFTDIYTGGISGPTTFGPGGSFPASSGTTTAPSNSNAGIDGAAAELFVPGGYTAGDPFTVESTWDNTTLSDLGLTPGTYTWTWGSVGNGTADSLEVVIPSSTGVPEPLTLSLFGAGLLGMAVMRKRKLRKAA
jgi:hypothetical protein